MWREKQADCARREGLANDGSNFGSAFSVTHTRWWFQNDSGQRIQRRHCTPRGIWWDCVENQNWNRETLLQRITQRGPGTRSSRHRENNNCLEFIPNADEYSETVGAAGSYRETTKKRFSAFRLRPTGCESVDRLRRLENVRRRREGKHSKELGSPLSSAIPVDLDSRQAIGSEPCELRSFSGIQDLLKRRWIRSWMKYWEIIADKSQQSRFQPGLGFSSRCWRANDLDRWRTWLRKAFRRAHRWNPHCVFGTRTDDTRVRGEFDLIMATQKRACRWNTDCVCWDPISDPCSRRICLD